METSELMKKLQQFLKSSLVLLQCQDYENFVTTKLHPVDLHSLPVMGLSLDELLHMLEHGETNLSATDFQILITCALDKLIMMQSEKEPSSCSWSFFFQTGDTCTDTNILFGRNIGSGDSHPTTHQMLCKQRYQASAEAFYRHRSTVSETQKEDVLVNDSHLDGQVLALRFVSTQGKWFICNF